MVWVVEFCVVVKSVFFWLVGYLVLVLGWMGLGLFVVVGVVLLSNVRLVSVYVVKCKCFWRLFGLCGLCGVSGLWLGVFEGCLELVVFGGVGECVG